MNSIDYISRRNKIYLDTSAAMHYRGFEKFVKQNEKTFVDMKKKIIIVKPVWLELIKLYNSSDKRKSEAASCAISIISSHRNIFDIEDEKVFQYEMENAFADKVLLSNIILDKTDSSILLITNDRMLSKDALEINCQASCRGYRISTCFISEDGELYQGYNSDKYLNLEETCEVDEKVNKGIEITNKDKSDIVDLILPIGTLFIGMAIGKHGDKIINYVKKTV